MTFRNPDLHNANRAGDELESSRHMTGKGDTTPMPIEATVHDLAEARERADAGIRLALPQFAESVGIDQCALSEEESPVDSDWAEIIDSWIGDGRSDLFEAMKTANRCGDDLAGIAIGEQINRLDALRETLKERWGS